MEMPDFIVAVKRFDGVKTYTTLRPFVQALSDGMCRERGEACELQTFAGEHSTFDVSIFNALARKYAQQGPDRYEETPPPMGVPQTLADLDRPDYKAWYAMVEEKHKESRAEAVRWRKRVTAEFKQILGAS